MLSSNNLSIHIITLPDPTVKYMHLHEIKKMKPLKKQTEKTSFMHSRFYSLISLIDSIDVLLNRLKYW